MKTEVSKVSKSGETYRANKSEMLRNVEIGRATEGVRLVDKFWRSFCIPFAWARPGQ